MKPTSRWTRPTSDARPLPRPLLPRHDPSRCGVLIESPHSICGLDPSDDMAYASGTRTLERASERPERAEVRQDKSFGSVDLRRAFNTVWVWSGRL